MDLFSIGASAIRASERRMAASAHNVANLNSQAFRPLRVTQESVDGGGVRATTAQSQSEAGVDLASELVEQIQARTQLQASLRVLSVGSEVSGNLVDLLA